MMPVQGVETFTLGPLETNCYLVYGESGSIIVDPGWPGGVEELVSRVEELGVEVKAIIATHGHFDHVMGVGRLRSLLGEVPFYIHAKDYELARRANISALRFTGALLESIPEPNGFLAEGGRVFFDGVEVVILETPGHTPGSISLWVGGMVFVGDLLFRGSVGRTDFPGGSWSDMVKSLERIAGLPPETIVYPGHGPSTTIGLELSSNPFLLELGLGNRL